MEEIEELLSHVYTDILMLQDGTWIPDKDTTQETINNIEALALKLNININDLRE